MASGEKPGFSGWTVDEELGDLSVSTPWTCHKDDAPESAGVLRRLTPDGAPIERSLRGATTARLEELAPPEPDSATSAKLSGRELDEHDVPALARILDSELREDPMVIEEQLVGQTLREYLSDAAVTGPVPSRNLKIAHSLLTACHALCDAGIEHGNLHPGNVVLTDDDRVRLGGFSWPSFSPVSARELPRSSEWLELLSYCAPEAYEDDGRHTELGSVGWIPHHWDDYWALGVMLYELLEGRTPFPLGDGDFTDQWSDRITKMKAQDHLAPVREAAGDNPRDLDHQLVVAIREQCTAFTATDPNGRFLMRLFTFDEGGGALKGLVPALAGDAAPEDLEIEHGADGESGDPEEAAGDAEAEGGTSKEKAKVQKAKAKKAREKRPRKKRNLWALVAFAALIAVVVGVAATVKSQMTVPVGFGQMAGNGLGINAQAAVQGSAPGTLNTGAGLGNGTTVSADVIDGGGTLKPCKAAGSRASAIGGRVPTLAQQACFCDNDEPTATPQAPDLSSNVFIRKGMLEEGAAFEMADKNLQQFCEGLAVDSDWSDQELKVSASVLSECLCYCGHPVDGDLVCKRNKPIKDEWSKSHPGYRYNLWRGELATPRDVYPMDEPLLDVELRCMCK